MNCFSLRSLIMVLDNNVGIIIMALQHKKPAMHVSFSGNSLNSSS